MKDNTSSFNQNIKKWMTSNVSQFVDECGEVNTTAMVESWDAICSSGDATLDSLHPAWFIADEVANRYAK